MDLLRQKTEFIKGCRVAREKKQTGSYKICFMKINNRFLIKVETNQLLETQLTSLL